MPLLRAFLLVFLALKAQADCDSDIQEYFQGLNPSSLKLWSLQMFDSSSKAIGSGILDASLVYQLGNYDQCLAVRGPKDPEGNPKFKGQYCQYYLGFEGKQMDILNETITTAATLQQNTQQIFHGDLGRFAKPVSTFFQWSVCAPSTCGPDGAKKVADFNLQFFSGALTLTPNVSIISRSCYFENDGSKVLDAGSWVFLSFEALLLLWICFATAYDHWNSDLEISGWVIFVNAFSLKTTVKDLVKLPKTVAPGQLSCLHGIRVMSTLWVLLGHSFMLYQSWPLTNYLSAMSRYMSQWQMAPLMNAFLSVDTFFILSGLLTTYVPLMDLKKGRKFNIIKFYVYRYLRITVPLAIFIFFLSTVYDRIGHGPLWFNSAGYATKNCQENWWPTLLYITNYVYRSCLGQGWYLSVDMQLAFLAPLVLIPLMKWPKYGLGAILLLTLGSMAACFGITYVESYPWTVSLRLTTANTGDFMVYFYPNTLLRAVPYLVGMALGYILANKKNIQIPKWSISLGWILSAALCLLVVFSILISYDPDYKYDRLDAAFYAGFHKLGWSLGVGWVIWACASGFGGVVNSILSWKYFLPLSKLSFCAYLVHQDFMMYHLGFRRSVYHITNFEMLFEFFGNIVCIFPLAVYLYLAVEAPTMMLLRNFFRKKGPKETREKEF